MSAELRAIGIVVAAHGLQGTVKVDFLTDFPERFLSLKECLLRHKGGDTEEVAVKRVKLTTGQALVNFESYKTRDDAENLRGAELCVRDEDSWPLPENTYFITDIIDFCVIGDDQTPLGNLAKVIRGAQDVLQVEGEQGELLVPFVDEWVGEVDTVKRTIVIKHWRRLIEADQA